MQRCTHDARLRGGRGGRGAQRRRKARSVSRERAWRAARTAGPLFVPGSEMILSESFNLAQFVALEATLDADIYASQM